MACSDENQSRRQELATLAQEVKVVRESFPVVDGAQLVHTAEVLLRMVELMTEDDLLIPELADV